MTTPDRTTNATGGDAEPSTDATAFASAVTTAADATAKQRLVFSLPNPETVLVLGSKHWAGIGYEGVSAITSSDILLQGMSDDSMARIETPGNVWIQSTGSFLTMASKNDLLIYSEDKSYVAGKKWLVLTSGAEGPQHPGWGVLHDRSEVTDAPLDQMTTQIKSVRKVVKTAVTYTTIGITGLSLLSIMAGWVTKSGTLASMLMLGLVGAANYTLTPDMEGDTQVFGANNVTVSSENFANLVAGNTVLIAGGQFATVYANLSAGVMALGSASITAAITASVFGGIFADISSMKSVSMTSRWGDVTIWGKTVDVGIPVIAGMQSHTSSIKMSASDLLKFSAGVTGLSGVDIETTGTTIRGPAHTIIGDTGVTVTSNGYAVDVGADGIAMVYSAPSIAATKVVEAANVQFEVAYAAAAAAYAAGMSTLGRRPAGYPITVSLLKANFKAQTAAARNTLRVAMLAAKKMILGAMRVSVSATEVHMAGGLGKISVDIAGNIIIDGKGMPVTIKSGAASIVVTAAGIKMGPIIAEG